MNLQLADYAASTPRPGVTSFLMARFSAAAAASGSATPWMMTLMPSSSRTSSGLGLAGGPSPG